MTSDILFVVLDGKTRASTRSRVYNYLPYVEEAGIEYDIISIQDIRDKIFSQDHLRNVRSVLSLLVKARKYDKVFIQKLLPPSPFTTALTQVSRELIFDMDDALYTTPQWERGDGWNKRLSTMLRTASTVVTGNPTLSEYTNRYCDEVITLPTPIPRDQYEPRRNRHETTDVVTLGWIGNPENLHYLATIEDVLGSVLDRWESVSLQVITSGEKPVVPLKERRGVDVFYKEWTLDTSLDLLSESDIGIRPLTTDEWTRGKGGFTSVIECMGMGIPVVVTPVTMLEEVITHGESGFHATTEDEWEKYLDRLISDRSFRKQMGDEAFQAVGEHEFWTEQRAEKFLTVLNE